MKDNEQIKKDQGILYSTDIEHLKSMAIQLDNIIKSNAINEDNLRTITNLSNEINTFRESFTIRLLKLYKQNHII